MKIVCNFREYGLQRYMIRNLAYYCGVNDYTSHFAEVYDELKSQVKYGGIYDLANIVWSMLHKIGYILHKGYTHKITESDLDIILDNDRYDGKYLDAIRSDVDTRVQLIYSNMTMEVLLKAGITKLSPGGCPDIKVYDKCTLHLYGRRGIMKRLINFGRVRKHRVSIAVNELNVHPFMGDLILINGEKYDKKRDYTNFLITTIECVTNGYIELRY